MIDADGETKGVWRQNGNVVSLAFYSGEVIYTGTISGSEMVGSARNNRTTWQWRLRKE